MSLRFKVEWQDAPGVKDLVERQTWARLVIEADGADEPLTRCLDLRTQQLRDGVNGSIFPLVRWLVRAYWNLLHEEPRVPGARAGRELAGFPGFARWLGRHNLLTAREGYALPDLTLARDGESIALWSFADPRSPNLRAPVRFSHEGTLRLPIQEVALGINALVEGTLERLRSTDHPCVEALRRDWDAVTRSMDEERDLCEWSARMGLDPYDPDDLDDETAAYLEGAVAAVHAGARSDLLDAVNAIPALREGLTWLGSATARLEGSTPTTPAPTDGPGSFAPAHEVGYWAARAVRREHGFKMTDREPVYARLCDRYALSQSGAAGVPSFIDGLVTATAQGSPSLIGPKLSFEDNAFRWSRALYLWRFGHAVAGPRLVTRAYARIQRESRAFAAELLAPAAAIKRALPGEVISEDDIRQLADDFMVRPKLVRHQIENHQLALIE